MRKGWVLYGTVQGVGFRAFTRRRARELGLAGQVRNRADGTVEVWAEGGAQALEDLVASLHVGPSGSRVDEVRPVPVDGGARLPLPFASVW